MNSTSLPISRFKNFFWPFLKSGLKSQWMTYLVAGASTGLLAVGYARSFRWAEDASLVIYDINPYYFFILGPLCFVVGSWILLKWAPGAMGTGIPQVMAALEIDENEHRALFKSYVGWRMVPLKILSSIICIFGGGIVGREGPTLQIGAAVFIAVNRLIRRFGVAISNHAMIVAGAAAGIAAAFNTPLGGIVYAIEELSSLHFTKFRKALLTAVIVAGLVAQMFNGSYLYLGYVPLKPFAWSIIPLVLLIGAVAGVAGAGFGEVVFRCVKMKQSLDQKYFVPFALLAGLLVAVLGWWVGPQARGGGAGLMSDLLSDHAKSSALLICVRMMGSILTYLSGCAGGIFAPSLAVGAAIGAEAAQVLSQLDHRDLLILVGMIGFLTGVTRAPFTAFVLVIEMSDRHSAIFPLMIGALAAESLAALVNTSSFYELMKYSLLPVPRIGSVVSKN